MYFDFLNLLFFLTICCFMHSVNYSTMAESLSNFIKNINKGCITMFQSRGTTGFLRLLVCSIVLGFYGACAMDQAIILQPDEIVWKVFFSHNRDGLAYADEHSFAQTSRNNCALIYATQDRRKNCVSQYLKKNKILFAGNAQFVFHRSWRIFGAIDSVSTKGDNALLLQPRLRMFSCELHENQSPVGKIAIWDTFTAKLPHNPSPFFNNNKELCFYGLHEERFIDLNSPSRLPIWRGFIEYTINDVSACKLLIPGKRCEALYVGLVFFLKFPVLLKNILDIDEPTIGFFGNVVPMSKIYDINKVKLSDNYQDFKDIPRVTPWVKSFKNLSERVRKALAQRYKDQQKKK